LDLQSATGKGHLKIDRKALEECYDSCGINARRVPVLNCDADDLGKKLPACVDELYDLLSAWYISCILHCTAGCGRSPTVAIAYLHWHRGMVLADAWDYVRSRRKCSPTIEAFLTQPGSGSYKDDNNNCSGQSDQNVRDFLIAQLTPGNVAVDLAAPGRQLA
jgi:hypothetical protein